MSEKEPDFNKWWDEEGAEIDRKARAEGRDGYPAATTAFYLANPIPLKEVKKRIQALEKQLDSTMGYAHRVIEILAELQLKIHELKKDA